MYIRQQRANNLNYKIYRRVVEGLSDYGLDYPRLHELHARYDVLPRARARAPRRESVGEMCIISVSPAGYNTRAIVVDLPRLAYEIDAIPAERRMTLSVFILLPTFMCAARNTIAVIIAIVWIIVNVSRSLLLCVPASHCRLRLSNRCYGVPLLLLLLLRVSAAR